MKYKNIVKGKFLERPNRFISYCEIDNNIEKVHVKNTGKCKELLIPNCVVYLEESDNPNRKTKYSLISVQKNDRLINMDSQVPNKVVYEGLINNKIVLPGLDEEIIHIKPKTERGVKHINELIKASKDGYLSYIIFVVQMSDVKYFTPNDKMHKELGDALRNAKSNGVNILAYDCNVTSDTIEIKDEVKVIL